MAASSASNAPHRAVRLSCIVCAYNEADRLAPVLSLAAAHPAIDEIIVVDDGSTDGTEALLKGWAGIRHLSHMPNRGKAFALARGVAAARGEYLLLLDADLSGLRASDLDALIQPVLSGAAQASLSLRGNSLWIYRLIGLDFVSGERVIPASLLRDARDELARLPPWGAEAFINARMVETGLRLAIARWPGVLNVRKGEKVGLWRGLLEELRMVRDALAVLTPLGALRQNLGLLRLASPIRRDPTGRRPPVRRRARSRPATPSGAPP